LQNRLNEIILEANPIKKEESEYAERLAAAGLYGKEKIDLTKEQQEALEILEKQHQERLKQAREEAFQQEHGKDIQENRRELEAKQVQLEFEKSTGATYGIDAFNQEKAIAEERIRLINEEIEMRRAAGLDISKINEDKVKAEQSLTETYMAEFNRRTDMYNQYGEAVLGSLANIITGEKDAMENFADSMLDLTFDLLTQIINAEMVKLTATATGAIARTTAEQVATKGFAGIGTAAILTAVITGAMTVAKTALKNLLHKKKDDSSTSPATAERVYTGQQAAGKYDVIGESDGKLYRGVPYAGAAKTGLVLRPTLVGENGGELVVSSPDLKALQKHINYPYIIQALQDVRSGRVAQQASGEYRSIAIPAVPAAPENRTEPTPVERELLAVLSELRNKKLEINYYEFETAQNTITKARAGANKR
jgi:hypothetical protein